MFHVSKKTYETLDQKNEQKWSYSDFIILSQYKENET